MAGMPPEGAAAPEASGGDVGEAIVQADKILSALAQGLAQSPQAPEGAAESMAAVLEQFRAVVDGVMASADGGAPEGPGPGGPTTPEQGGNPNARPVGV